MAVSGIVPCRVVTVELAQPDEVLRALALELLLQFPSQSRRSMQSPVVISINVEVK